MAPIVHVVFFQFKPELTAIERTRASHPSFRPGSEADQVPPLQLCDQMLRLKDSCLHPQSEKPYIQSSMGGLDKSIEGAHGGMTHAFVVQFASQEDRDYYVQEDPAHRTFVDSILPNLVKARIIDFTPGVFR
ncbi:hypothetical protein XA68_13061 [Ophiocordyceps unilateralis]|uniref:Stress-response A/B barrel domain-containing protein n=1 Tax=Ophiocordyceps unilateralis TaxID=268505 RepID=A0A2A9PDB8_OPHUN|nr:hypothetical protein XA68_13061 [Ophiocordyceps unilateralis]